jgi:hypothetical protein
MPDEQYLKKKYKIVMGETLNLDNPQTFGEKMQWLKLYDRKPEYTIMVDKYLMRKFVAEKLGDGYSIPLIGVWNSPDEINFEELPNQFVLKCNHNSGAGMCICRDKNKLDIKQVKAGLKRGLQQNYYLNHREWPYKDVPRRIIAEKYMEQNDDMNLTDYKFFCFNGEPKIMYISKDNAEVPLTDFFDMDFNHLPIRMKDKNAEILSERPICFDDMRDMAGKLSADVPFLRVDFYYIDSKIYVGELTFYHNAGFTKVNPKEWDIKLGEMIELPIKTREVNDK